MDWSLKRTLRSRRRGDAVVEFVLLAPILLIILFGIMEVGRVVDAWLIVENAAREGAREAVNSPMANIASVGQQATTTYLNSALAGRDDVTSILVPMPTADANGIQVHAQINIELYTPIFRNMLPSPMPVRATASMRR
jgi:Flp pilus assembly protein TadG